MPHIYELKIAEVCWRREGQMAQLKGRIQHFDRIPFRAGHRTSWRRPGRPGRPATYRDRARWQKMGWRSWASTSTCQFQVVVPLKWRWCCAPPRAFSQVRPLHVWDVWVISTISGLHFSWFVLICQYLSYPARSGRYFRRCLNMGSHRDRKEGARRIGSSAYLGTLKPLMTARLVVIIITNSLTLSQLNSKRVKLLHSTDLAQTHWFRMLSTHSKWPHFLNVLWSNSWPTHTVHLNVCSCCLCRIIWYDGMTLNHVFCWIIGLLYCGYLTPKLGKLRVQ